MSKETAITAAKKIGVIITDSMINKLERYIELIQDRNTRTNLTRIQKTDEIWIKHYYDSWLLAEVTEWNGTGKIIDVGSGAGFPGIPLKIVYPELEMILLDSMGKRVNFLRSVIETLDLNGIQAVNGRAEDFARVESYRESFDWVVSRAVADLRVLAEYCLPFTSIGGWCVAYKGSDAKKEIIDSEFAIEELGGRIEGSYESSLTLEFGKRNLIMIHKVSKSPAKYPRKSGVPAKRPLGTVNIL
jgi:16S rRNA (guanine527-N7)-methyltransferase